MKGIVARLLLLLLLALPVMAQRIVIITGGTVTANVTDSADFYVTLNQNVTGVTLTSTVTPATGYIVSMKFVQDATGSRTVVFGGNISTSCAVNSTANSVTICRWQYTASSNAWADAAGGAAAPSSLTTFFNGFMGKAPQDFGAFGDGIYVYDCGIPSGQTLVTCPTTTPFTSAAVDVGKVVEFKGAGAAGGVLVSTIASFVSSSQVNLVATASTTVAQSSNHQLLFAHDDTPFLALWAAYLSTKGGAHAGYLPKGVYYDKAPIRIVNSVVGANQFTSNSGECGPTSTSAANLPCPITIWGDGFGISIIAVATAGQFTWGTNAIEGVMYFSGWNTGGVIQNIAVVGDGTNHTVTSQTSAVGGMVFNQNAHVLVQGNWVQGISTSGAAANGHGISGLVSWNDFESSYINNALETNNNNLFLGGDTNGGAGGAGIVEKITFDTTFLENPNGTSPACAVIGSSTNTVVFKHIRFRNTHCLNGPRGFDFINGTTSNFDSIIFDSYRYTDGSVGDIGIYIESTFTGRLELDNPYYENVISNTQGLILNSSASEVHISEGSLRSTNGTCISNSSTGHIYLMDTTFNCSVNIGGSVPANVFAFIPTTSGWNGPGVLQNTLVLSNQGTVCATGNFALSAGWGTTATVTTAQGFGQTCKVTLTSSGTGQAATPTVTWTLPNALPTATIIGTAQMTGGTGATTLFDQTTLSATAPIWTFQGTPVAASTYITVFRMGP